MKTLCLLIICFLITSCGTSPRNLDGFSVYKYPINNGNKKLKHLGVYIQKRDTIKDPLALKVILFYDKGKCFASDVESNFWRDKDFWKYYNKHHVDYNKRYNNFFRCQYRISNDTIIVQNFLANYDSKIGDVFSLLYDIVERKYKILNENTLNCFEWSYYSRNLFGSKKSIGYASDTLTLLKVMPKFTFKGKQEWYEKRKRYKNKLHPSRK